MVIWAFLLAPRVAPIARLSGCRRHKRTLARQATSCGFAAPIGKLSGLPLRKIDKVRIEAVDDDFPLRAKEGPRGERNRGKAKDELQHLHICLNRL